MINDHAGAYPAPEIPFAVGMAIATRNATELSRLLALPNGHAQALLCMERLGQGGKGRIFFDQLRGMLPPLRHAPPFTGPYVGMLAWLAWRGVLPGRPHVQSDPVGAAAIFSHLASIGWVPQPAQLRSLVDASSDMRDCASLVVFAENGWLPALDQDCFEGRLNEPHRFCAAFGKQSVEDLAALGRLVDLGVIVNADGFVGLMDFAALGLYECAKVLDAKGFDPRPLALTRMADGDIGPSAPGPLSPASALARLMCGNFWRQGSGHSPCSWLGSAQEAFDWLAAKGPLMPEGPWERHSDPFCSISSAADRSPDLVEGVLDALASHGIHAGQSERYLSEELQAMDGQSEQFVGIAIARGAHRGADPRLVFNALASWTRDFPSEGQPHKRPPALDPNGLRCSERNLAFSTLVGWRPTGAVSRAIAFGAKLCELGLDPSSLPQGSGASEIAPTLHAAAKKNFEFVRFLLSRGVPASSTSLQGQTILHLLAQDKSPDSTALAISLLEIPANRALVDAISNPMQSTALMQAARFINIDCAKALLDAGANPNLRDAKGLTALGYLARKSGKLAVERSEAMARLLIGAGADPMIATHEGATPAMTMAANAPLGAIAAIIEAAPDVFSGPSGGSARAALAARGEAAVSIVERAELMAVPLASTPAAFARKPRSRL